MFFLKVLRSPKIDLQAGKKNLEIYYTEDLNPRTLQLPPELYKEQDADKCDRKSDLGVDSMDKLNNLRTKENYCCLQYYFSTFLRDTFRNLSGWQMLLLSHERAATKSLF